MALIINITRVLSFISMTCLFLISSSLKAQVISTGTSEGSLNEEAEKLLYESFHLAGEMQNEVWPGISEAPFVILLITENHEFLINHPNPTDDFTNVGYNSLIDDSIFSRKRQFPTSLRASFPAVAGVPTIVIGMPDSTESATEWVLTVLHEHFHQWQMSQSGYYRAVNDLDLSNGDNTGQWMLNYDFPYDSESVQKVFQSMKMQLLSVINAIDTPTFLNEYEKYVKLRQQFNDALEPDDYRYYAFQVWQEGVARYVEYKMGEWASEYYIPTNEIQSLESFEPFETVAKRIRSRVLSRLSESSLAADRRLIFYPVGAAEAIILDKIHPGWQLKYSVNTLNLDAFFKID